MKKGFRKEIVRSITHSWSRFLAIMAIVALGAGFFAGLQASAPNMRSTADSYYDKTNMMDVHLLSTMGFTDNDVDAVKKASGIESVMPTYFVDAVAQKGDFNDNIRVHGLPYDYEDKHDDYINQLTLTSGRLPKNTNECVLDTGRAEFSNFGLGDKISLSIPNKDIKDSLKQDEYEIVGFANSPNYISFSYGTTDIGNGKLERYMYVLNDAFSTEVYTELFATVKDAKPIATFDDSYEEHIKPVTNNLKILAKEREQIRYGDIMATADGEIADAQREFDKEKNDALKKLADAKIELDDGMKEADSAGDKLKKGRTEYDAGVAALIEQKKQFQAQYDEQLAGVKQLALQDETQANAAMQQLEMGKQQAQAKFDEADKQLASSKAALLKGEEELAKARKKLADGKSEYETQKADADKKLADAQEEINDAKAKIDDIDEPEWFVLDRQANIGFVEFKSDATRMSSIATTFPIIFFMVAALVALTTMTRMVEEERGLIGIYKAIGYHKGTIMSKYLIYAALASIVGSIIGIIICYNVLPRIVWNAYGLMYSADPYTPQFHWGYALMAGGAATFCTLLSTFLACRSTLHETPAELMLPRAPKAGRRILLERITPLWKHFSFLIKVTARNLFRYKKRMLMTVIGIAGCTALLVTGYGIKDSVSDIITNQYQDIFQYDAIVGMDSDKLSETTLEKINNKDNFSEHLLTMSKGFDVLANGKKINGTLLVPENPEKFKDFICLRTRSQIPSKAKPIEFNDDSVIVSEKMVKTLGIKVGDNISLSNNDYEAELTITGITENYIGQYVYISPKIYENVFGEAPIYKEVYAKKANANIDEAALSKDLRSDKNITTVQFIGDMTSGFEGMMSSLNSVIVVLIISAGLLAFIVLYNLTNINVTERERELATIKVLGFYDNEVSGYIYRETAVLTIIGCIVGLIFGVFMHNYVIQTVEVDMVMFSRKIHAMSFVWSAVLTASFALIVNFVMYFKLKKIDMVESLKSVE